MPKDAYETLCTEPELRTSAVRMLGTGASAPTKVFGAGITITRTSTGLYKLTWASDPGVFAGLAGKPAVSATTQADVAGHDVVAGAWDATLRTLSILFVGTTQVAHDLAALEWIDLSVRFKQTSVLG